MNVLIVDDHPMMLEYLFGAVARAFDGATVRTAMVKFSLRQKEKGPSRS